MRRRCSRLERWSSRRRGGLRRRGGGENFRLAALPERRGALVYIYIYARCVPVFGAKGDGAMSKYAPLGQFLRDQDSDEVAMTFAQIERIIGAKLPRSQYDRGWWSNNPQNNVMTRVWLGAGYLTKEVDIRHRKLVFRRIDARRLPPSNDDRKRAAISSRHPLYGWLKGTVRIAPGVDLTEPADPEWGNRIDE